MNSPPTQPRFLGLDLHRASVVIAGVDAQQNIVLQPRRLSIGEFEAWAGKNLRPTDSIALEATANAWDLFDQLQPLVASVSVAHPQLVKLITSARVKTDPGDAFKLARLLAAGLIPAVWVPPPHVRELRALVAHRRRLINQRTRARNHLHGALHRHNLFAPEGDPFGPTNRSWWEELDVSPSEKLRIRHDLITLESLKPLIEEAEAELIRLSTAEPWARDVPFLIQLPGIAVLSAMTLLSAIGDISRFPTAKKLVGYSGLGASVHDSGQTQRGGKITKQGRREIRTTLVETAWRAVDSSAYWQLEFDRLCNHIGKMKAIVAIARKILVRIWHVLSKHEPDNHAIPEKVASKLLAWATDLGPEGRQGVSPPLFVRRHLTTLQLGESLETYTHGGRLCRLPPLEVIASPHPVDNTS
jgi:transposase